MQSFRTLTKPVVYAVLLSFVALTLHVPIAQAGLVSTESVVDTKQAHAARERLLVALARDEARQALLARGVSPEQIQARMDALTDAEIQQLAAKIDQLPAGGDVFSLVVFVFLVLLLTDIIGVTDIFPFVKKPARR